MIKALGHVVPSHLLDTRLNPVAETTVGGLAVDVGLSRV